MKPSLYKELVETLDAAVNNGFEDEILMMAPSELLADVRDHCGEHWLAEVPDAEIEKVMDGWLRKQRALAEARRNNPR